MICPRYDKECQRSDCIEGCCCSGLDYPGAPDEQPLPRFDGCKLVFTLKEGERFLGMVNWRGDIVISTTERVLMYETAIDKIREVKLGGGTDG